VLLIVDQPNTVGALPIAVARTCDCAVAYLSSLAMRSAADLYPGKAKTDPGTRSSLPKPCLLAELGELVVEARPGRLKACANDECNLFLLDRTRPGTAK
jgi:predicted RNA-binding Zn ribbon-like protein